METLSPSSEPTKPVEAEYETVMPMSASKTMATPVEVAHETLVVSSEPAAADAFLVLLAQGRAPHPASSVAHVMVQKYQQSMPLYRQEREWKEIGIPLSRATLANWVIRLAEDWLISVAASTSRCISSASTSKMNHPSSTAQAAELF